VTKQTCHLNMENSIFLNHKEVDCVTVAAQIAWVFIGHNRLNQNRLTSVFLAVVSRNSLCKHFGWFHIKTNVNIRVLVKKEKTRKGKTEKRINNK
jgi:hypothetical protein